MNREVLTELSRTTAGLSIATTEDRAFKEDLLAALRDDFDRRPNDYRVGVDLLQVASQLATRDTSLRGDFRAYLNPVIELAPRRPEAYFLAGAFAFQQGEVEEGRRQYLAATQLNPAVAFPYWALGRELVGVGHSAEAQPLIEGAITRGFDFNSPAALTTLIRMYHALGDSARAGQYASIARRTFPSVLDSTLTP